MQTVKFSLESLVELSSVRLLLPPDLRAPEKRAAVALNMKEAIRRCACVVESYLSWICCRVCYISYVCAPCSSRCKWGRAILLMATKCCIPHHENRLKGTVPKLHPIEDMGIQDPAMEKLLARETQLQLRLEGLPFHKDEHREEELQRYTSSVSTHDQSGVCTHVYHAYACIK